MKRLFSLVLLSILTGCATVQDTTRISSDLEASEFNSIASQYMYRPTFVSIETLSSGEKILTINMKTYKVSQYGDSLVLRFSNQLVDSYISFVDKFLSWETLATERKDILEKEIGEEDSLSSGMGGYLKFTFYSGNESSHYLAVALCSGLICLDNAHYYDRDNAIKLKQILEELKADNFKPNNLDNVYQ